MGTIYGDLSLPSWYSAEGLHKMLAAAPLSATVGEVVKDLFGIDFDDARSARSLNEAAVVTLHKGLAQARENCTIGWIGHDILGGCCRRVMDTATIDGAAIPFCIEAWVQCEPAEKGDELFFGVFPLINRSAALTQLYHYSDSAGLRLHGCGIDMKMRGPKRASYSVILSLITPLLQLMSDGKTPYLGDFADAIRDAVKGAASEAYRKMVRPPASMSVKDAAYAVMREAYLKVSDGGKLPAKARQIMYAARGKILEFAGVKKFGDSYFTQVLLPSHMRENPEETDNWDVIYDARGNFSEPHTGQCIPLGTLQVRQYLGERPTMGTAIKVDMDTLYTSSGPTNRYRNILFVEKEGFDELFQAVSLRERFDIALMSTKGMSVVAARALLDRLAYRVDNVFVVHDFDISGFSILGTLAADSDRYTFRNKVPIIDVGLRLKDIEAIKLEAEAVEVENRASRRQTLCEHGARPEEIDFLAPYEGPCQRVELNAMTSRQLVDFVEAALRAHGVEKVVPDSNVIEKHARRLVEAKITQEAIDDMRAEIALKAAEAALPDGLCNRISMLLAERPELSWDGALGEIIGAPRVKRGPTVRPSS